MVSKAWETNKIFSLKSCEQENNAELTGRAAKSDSGQIAKTVDNKRRLKQHRPSPVQFSVLLSDIISPFCHVKGKNNEIAGKSKAGILSVSCIYCF